MFQINSRISKKSIKAMAAGVAALATATILVSSSYAAPSANPDPYADAVEGSQSVVLEPNNSLGAPNGTNASLAGVGASITLDMGDGEEGTQTLKVYLGQINAQVNINVAFLDSNKAVIFNTDRQLGADVNPSAQNFAYDWKSFGKAYRYVRVSSTAGAGVSIDAVEALGYVGSTANQDTDGDGTPDRTEQQKGTNVLDASSKPSSSGGSGQVNKPPAKSDDTDGDGMPNSFETKYGLDPKDASDADKDKDSDGLSNKQEYGLGSDPTKADTDGDGLPDKWEFEHGTDILKDDADNDPDGDYLTNLGEYKNNTDPQKADDLTKVFCKDDPKTTTTAAKGSSKTPWLWVIVAFVLGAVADRLLKAKQKSSKKQSKLNNTPTDTNGQL